MLVVGIALLGSTVALAVTILTARGTHIRLNAPLTQSSDSATTRYPFSDERGHGGRPGGRDGRRMAVIVDDLRAGSADTLRHEMGPAVGFAIGMLMIGLGIVFQEHLPFRGATLISIGGVLIAMAVYVPYMVHKRNELDHPGDYITREELAEVESAFQAYNAARERELAGELETLRETLAGLNAQL